MYRVSVKIDPDPMNGKIKQITTFMTESCTVVSGRYIMECVQSMMTNIQKRADQYLNREVSDPIVTLQKYFNDLTFVNDDIPQMVNWLVQRLATRPL